MTKTMAVWKHLKEHGSITSLEAIELYGATRLSSIIFNLRKAGHCQIDTLMVDGHDRLGNASGYAKYVLVPKGGEVVL